MKCIGAQYLEAIFNLSNQGFSPVRQTIHITFVPDEEMEEMALDGWFLHQNSKA
jgi:hypothetical protein